MKTFVPSCRPSDPASCCVKHQQKISKSICCQAYHRPAKTTIEQHQHEKANGKMKSMRDAAIRTGALSSIILWSSVAVAAQAQEVVAAAVPYTPSPMETPSWEIWVGFVAGVVPFAIATFEFSKRILIQRRCEVCQGRGLVQRGRVLRKCSQVCYLLICISMNLASSYN